MTFSAPEKHIRGCIAILILLLLGSCSEEKRTTVKNYPHNTPFIYNNKILVTGNITKDEKKRLTGDLDNYWDDSLRVAKLQKFGIFYTIKDPAVFDPVNVARSKKLMNAYLNSQGYYYANFKDSIPRFDTVRDQVRATVIMNIALGKNITIDSTGYDMIDSTMQQLALQNSKNSLLKKGGPYTKQIISNELDRVTSIFRDSGYYKLTRDDVFALVDTTDAKLLKLSFDPLEQAQLIGEAAKSRKEDPKWDIIIQQKPIIDSSRLRKFHIGTLYFYPETKLTDIPDSLMKETGFTEERRRLMVMRYTEGKFSYKPLRDHSLPFIKNKDLYNESAYYKSLSSLGHLGAWQQVDARTQIRDKDTLDIYYFLVPTLKQNFVVTLEASLNTGDITAGNLAGISTNFTYRNRNVWKQSIQSVTNLGLGTELNIDRQKIANGPLAPLLQTFQISLSHSYSFPKLIVPFRNSRFLNRLDNKRTILSTAASYTDRRDVYELRNLTASLGYEWRGRDSITWLFKPLNVELYKIDTLPLLDSLFLKNPFLRNSFRNGNVVGTSLSLTKTFNSRRNHDVSHFLRFGFEESGTLISLFGSIGNNIFKYVKLESEYKFLQRFRSSSSSASKSELAARLFVGVGLPKAGESLPVFKQYYLGGPNSMRAWGLRQLGLGSSITSDTSSGYTDRFGDLAIEANAEYRFTIFDFSSFKIGSALYADMGNVWNLRKDPSNPNAEFDPSRIGKDLAIGVGTGLRFNFTYFLVRIDFAFKLKDPARLHDGGWLGFNNFQWTDTRQNGVKIRNYDFQLGIGLPF